MNIEIQDARPIHAGMMSLRMRADDCREILALYDDVRKALRLCFRKSAIRRVAFVDGDIAAMWGVTGTLLSAEGSAWLVTTSAIERIPLAFFRIARQQLKEIMATRESIVGYVAADYWRAIQFMRMLGFSVAEPTPEGKNGKMFHVLTLRSGDI